MEQSPELAPILDDQGFRRMAAAIRRATVSEQFAKARQQQEYEIHYGLLQDLQRKARFKDQFVAALAQFVASYNTENARKAEMGAAGRGVRRRRPQVTTDDLSAVVRLLDKHRTETVAMLLLAYAAASNPQPGPAASAPETAEPAPEEPEAAGDDE